MLCAMYGIMNDGLNTMGGAAEVRTLELGDGIVRVNGGRDSASGDVVVPVTRPVGFGATHLDAGDVVAFLRRGTLYCSHDLYRFRR